MSVSTPTEFLVLELSHIEDAEQQASKALQKIADQAESKELRQMLERRLKQGERVLKSVEQALEKLDGKSQSSQNAAARGIIQENERMLREVKAPEMKQAVAIAGVQKLEHYCIAAWGTVKALAREMGEEELAGAMEEIIEEGERYDREMTELAESRINPAALQSSGEESGRESGQKSDRESSDRQSSSQQSGAGGRSSSGSGSRGGGSDEEADLRAREYRGEDGKSHHHTREYMERKGK